MTGMLRRNAVAAASAVDSEGTWPVLNHYRCPVCDSTWQAGWDCACNDRCPGCRREITPLAGVSLAAD